jgi:hypothetical protein
VEKLEAHQKAIAQAFHTNDKYAQAGVPLPEEASPSKSLVS